MNSNVHEVASDAAPTKSSDANNKGQQPSSSN